MRSLEGRDRVSRAHPVSEPTEAGRRRAAEIKRAAPGKDIGGLIVGLRAVCAGHLGWRATSVPSSLPRSAASHTAIFRWKGLREPACSGDLPCPGRDLLRVNDHGKGVS